MITVTGLFDDRAQAENAVRALHAEGIPPQDISVVMRDRREMEEFAEESDVTAAGGAVSGGVVGGLTGLLMGLGALAIPGVGPIIAAGPLAGALAGSVTGAITGGLLGALMDLGIEEEEAEIYRTGVQRGAVLLAVHTEDENAERVRTILNEYSRPLDQHREMWETDPDYEYRHERDSGASEAGGAAVGGIAGAATGAAMGGPAGAAIGGATGAAVGAAAADAMEEDESSPGTSASGGAIGGATGGVIGGAVGGPAGAAIGAGAGGALGAGSTESGTREGDQADMYRDDAMRNDMDEDTAGTTGAAFGGGAGMTDRPDLTDEMDEDDISDRDRLDDDRHGIL